MKFQVIATSTLYRNTFHLLLLQIEVTQLRNRRLTCPNYNLHLAVYLIVKT